MGHVTNCLSVVVVVVVSLNIGEITRRSWARRTRWVLPARNARTTVSWADCARTRVPGRICGVIVESCTTRCPSGYAPPMTLKALRGNSFAVQRANAATRSSKRTQHSRQFPITTFNCVWAESVGSEKTGKLRYCKKSIYNFSDSFERENNIVTTKADENKYVHWNVRRNFLHWEYRFFVVETIPMV